MSDVLVTSPQSSAFPLIAPEGFHFSVWHSVQDHKLCTPAFKDENGSDSESGLTTETRKKARSRKYILVQVRLESLA